MEKIISEALPPATVLRLLILRVLLLVLGFRAQATGTANGRDAVASAANSVALGANTVSVGSAGAERQVTNVADGTSDTDAVNLRQLHRTGSMSGLTPMPYDPSAKTQLPLRAAPMAISAPERLVSTTILTILS